MQKFDVQMALEATHEYRDHWSKAMRQFQAEVQKVMTRLMHEAAANFMSVEEVARHSGLSPKRVRTMMREAGLNPRDGKTLLSKQAAEALASNAELLGVAPHEVDLMSPLAYLPAGSELRQKITDATVSRVTELPDGDENTPYAERHCRCTTPLPSGSLNGGVEMCLWCSYILVSGNNQ